MSNMKITQRGKPNPQVNFVFPPPSFGDKMELVFYYMGKKTVFEDIKVMASRSPMDFSFLPVAENEIFVGVQGGDIKKNSGNFESRRGLEPDP